ncbi:protein of unknown function [Fodinibius roseus]|uniref:DUF4440 domain-containing protein n=1 Tax=Fodinibius roseus TaxID=1194090 RepID=A0A1M4X6I1_9BACT|nr:nuclear transport factor 2 family protein [Fodinibius roseus]SHE89108.1 protein of unknown function [Fodinibius roseus]
MTERAKKTHIKEVERIINHLMEDWMDNEGENLDRYFYDHVVMIEAGTNNRIMGVDNVLENYLLFIEDAKITDYKITDLFVELVEDTAIGYFTYRIKYEMDDTKFDESNTEILVFRKQENNWQIIWRTQLLGE